MTIEPRSIPAEEVLRKHWNGWVPIPVVDIAERLSVNVYAWKKHDMEDEQWTARYTPASKNARARIDLNVTLSDTHQRFAIAHALGHHVLTHGQQTNMAEHYDSNVDATIHQQANNFAMHLLIPSGVFEFLALHSTSKTSEEVAEAFFVSPLVASRQMAALSLTL